MVVTESPITIEQGKEYTLTVGAGGAGDTSGTGFSGSGNDSVFGYITSIKGGASHTQSDGQAWWFWWWCWL